jgi:ADP-dependent phosphofructokinase/glucokinase
MEENRELKARIRVLEEREQVGEGLLDKSNGAIFEGYKKMAEENERLKEANAEFLRQNEAVRAVLSGERASSV